MLPDFREIQTRKVFLRLTIGVNFIDVHKAVIRKKLVKKICRNKNVQAFYEKMSIRRSITPGVNFIGVNLLN